MAHNPIYSIAMNQAHFAALVAQIGNAGLLRIYDGAQPASPNVATTTQNLLSTHTCGTPFAPASTAAHPSVLTANAIGSAVAGFTSTAAWFRILTSAAVAVIDGTVGVGATFDLNLNSVAITSGQNIAITGLTITSAT
jgi:hypothetical protein